MLNAYFSNFCIVPFFVPKKVRRSFCREALQSEMSKGVCAALNDVRCLGPSFLDNCTIRQARNIRLQVRTLNFYIHCLDGTVGQSELDPVKMSRKKPAPWGLCFVWPGFIFGGCLLLCGLLAPKSHGRIFYWAETSKTRRTQRQKTLNPLCLGMC